MGQRRWSVTAEMAAAAFLAEQAGLQQQSAGALAVVQVQQQVEVTPTRFLQQELLISALTVHQRKRFFLFEPGHGPECCREHLSHPGHGAVHAGHRP